MIQNQVCPRSVDDKIHISTDGVKESKSTSISLDVFSSKLKDCRVVFPHKIVRPLGKYKGLDNKKIFDSFINNIIENGKHIFVFTADKAKRGLAKQCLGHASYFPCEYCFSRGVTITMKNDKKKITWPASTANGEPRTTENVLEIANRLENGEELGPEQRKGVKGKSIFLTLENFDYVMDSPAEYLHSCCLGVIKKLVELTFDVGENRLRNTTRKLSKAIDFNKLMCTILTPREFPRRARDLDFSVFKGAEFRNIAIFYFPLVVDCIEEGEGERKLWLYMAYMMRACTIPTCEWRYVDLDDIKKCCHKFYVLYERLFGKINCTYNTHVVCSHLPDIRFHGPLTMTSAFVFESFYGELRNSFVPGTVSPLKQIMQKIMLKRVLSYHSCELPIFYSNKNTALENNSLIYCWRYNTHHIYQINEVKEEYFICNVVEKSNHVFEEIHRLDWSKIGVYVKEIVTENLVFINKKDVSGKVLEVQKFLITCPTNILGEK